MQTRMAIKKFDNTRGEGGGIRIGRKQTEAAAADRRSKRTEDLGFPQRTLQSRALILLTLSIGISSSSRLVFPNTIIGSFCFNYNSPNPAQEMAKCLSLGL